MLALTIATTLGGLALGSYAAYRYAPTLARTPGSTGVGLIICALVGAACGLASLYIYLAIYALANEPALGDGLLRAPGGFSRHSPDADIFIGAVYSIVTESGVLLALAAGVFLLAPAHDESAD